MRKSANAEKGVFMNKKKILAVLLTVILTLSLAFAFAACTDDNVSKEGNITVVLMPQGGEATAYTVDLADLNGKYTVDAALDNIAANKGIELKYTESAATGRYYTQIGSVVENGAKGEYVYFYTSVEKDISVDQYATEIEYDGKKYVSSGVGASLMSVEKDCVIIISIIVF